MPEKMFARLHFRHPDFADDDLLVSTGLPLTDWLREFRRQAGGCPVYPYLGAGAAGDGDRHRQGDRSTACRRARRDDADADDEPLRGKMPVRATTDASGRYRAAGTAGETFWVTAFPDPRLGTSRC